MTHSPELRGWGDGSHGAVWCRFCSGSGAWLLSAPPSAHGCSELENPGGPHTSSVPWARVTTTGQLLDVPVLTVCHTAGPLLLKNSHPQGSRARLCFLAIKTGGRKSKSYNVPKAKAPIWHKITSTRFYMSRQVVESVQIQRRRGLHKVQTQRSRIPWVRPTNTK